MIWIFWIGFCILVGYFADKKGRSGVGWGLLAFIISPLLAGIALAKAYNTERAKKSESASVENTNLANRLSNLGGTIQQTFFQVRNYHSQNEYNGSAAQFERIKNEIINYINRLGIPEDARALLLKYNDNWYTLMVSKLETSNFSESQLRSAVQPTYTNLKRRIDNLNQTILYQEKQLVQLNEEAKYLSLIHI